MYLRDRQSRTAARKVSGHVPQAWPTAHDALVHGLLLEEAALDERGAQVAQVRVRRCLGGTGAGAVAALPLATHVQRHDAGGLVHVAHLDDEHALLQQVGEALEHLLGKVKEGEL